MSVSVCSLPVRDLEPGDTYLTGVAGGQEAREVLRVVDACLPFGAVVLEVRKQDGNVARSHLGGRVDVVRVAS